MLPACSPPPPGLVELWAVILHECVHPPIQVPVQAAKQLPLQSFLHPDVHPSKQDVLQEPVQLPVHTLRQFSLQPVLQVPEQSPTHSAVHVFSHDTPQSIQPLFSVEDP